MKVPTGAVISLVNYVKDLADNEVDNSFEVIPDIYVPVPDNNVLLFFNSRIETVFGYETEFGTVYFHSIIFSVYPTVDISLNEFTLVFLSGTDEWSELDSNDAYNYYISINGFDLYNSEDSFFGNETLLYSLLVNTSWEYDFENDNRRIRFAKTGDTSLYLSAGITYDLIRIKIPNVDNDLLLIDGINKFPNQQLAVTDYWIGEAPEPSPLPLNDTS